MGIFYQKKFNLQCIVSAETFHLLNSLKQAKHKMCSRSEKVISLRVFLTRDSLSMSMPVSVSVTVSAPLFQVPGENVETHRNE